eukprot:2873975-Rhodomonas_salina.1
MGVVVPLDDGGNHTICPLGPCMHLAESSDSILSHTWLKKAGYKITLSEGSDCNPTFGGVLTMPHGDNITLVYEHNMYSLPFSRPDSTKARTASTSVQHQLFACPM